MYLTIGKNLFNNSLNRHFKTTISQNLFKSTSKFGFLFNYSNNSIHDIPKDFFQNSFKKIKNYENINKHNEAITEYNMFFHNFKYKIEVLTNKDIFRTYFDHKIRFIDNLFKVNDISKIKTEIFDLQNLFIRNHTSLKLSKQEIDLFIFKIRDVRIQIHKNILKNELLLCNQQLKKRFIESNYEILIKRFQRLILQLQRINLDHMSKVKNSDNIEERISNQLEYEINSYLQVCLFKKILEYNVGEQMTLDKKVLNAIRLKLNKRNKNEFDELLANEINILLSSFEFKAYNYYSYEIKEFYYSKSKILSLFNKIDGLMLINENSNDKTIYSLFLEEDNVNTKSNEIFNVKSVHHSDLKIIFYVCFFDKFTKNYYSLKDSSARELSTNSGNNILKCYELFSKLTIIPPRFLKYIIKKDLFLDYFKQSDNIKQLNSVN